MSGRSQSGDVSVDLHQERCNEGVSTAGVPACAAAVEEKQQSVTPRVYTIPGNVIATAVSACLKQCAVAIGPGVAVWKISTKAREVLLHTSSSQTVSSLSFSPCSSILYAAGTGGLYRFCTSTWRKLSMLDTRLSYDVQATLCGKFVVVSGLETNKRRQIYVYDAVSEELVRTFAPHENWCNFAVTRCSTFLVTHGASEIRVWGLGNGALIKKIKDKALWCIAVSWCTQYIVAGYRDNKAAVFNRNTGERLLVLDSLDNFVTQVAITRCGKYILTATLYPGTLRVWDAATGVRLKTKKGATFALSPCSQLLMSCTQDSTSGSWESDTHTRISIEDFIIPKGGSAVVCVPEPPAS